MPDAGLSWETVKGLQRALERRRATSSDLVRHSLERIDAVDRSGPAIRSVIEVNPEAEELAAELDRERNAGALRGPLHGIPVLIKDNIDTRDGMKSTAGSLAMVDARPKQDAEVVRRVREAGLLLLGKTNLSEWANFRSDHSISGWSARGGQSRNPYALDRSPCGSSSGSGTAVAAGLVALAIGTETDGSILCPAAASGVVGIKPTVGRTSRSGVVPISVSQDTVGPFARNVRDAALLLAIISGADPRDQATSAALSHELGDVLSLLDDDGLRGARIGVPRKGMFGYSFHADDIADQAIELMKERGAVIVDPADFPSAEEMKSSEAEKEVLLYEFKSGLNDYLLRLEGDGPRSLEELIDFNNAHADVEMQLFGQNNFEEAQDKGPLTDVEYLEALATCRRMGRSEGIDAVLDEHKLDALVMPTGGPAFLIDPVNGDSHSGGSSTVAAIAGYPAITVPAGMARGLPVGITFIGSAWSEPTLIRLAHAYERASLAWQPPSFRATAVGF
jgi:amidase